MIIATLGSAGAAVITSANAVLIDAPVVEAVDTTGAGDCFNGTLAAHLASGREIVEATKIAVHAAAESVTTRGANNTRLS